MRKLASFGIYVFFLFLFILPLGELSLRGWERLIWATHCVKCESGLTIMGVRLNQRLWKMFLGHGARDLRVLPGNESTANLLPPNGHWDAVDFLLPENLREKHHFTVTSDAYGFRGPWQKVPSAAKTFRVLVLGSYQAFGHGVEDSETYSARLLELLRSSDVVKERGIYPVVWNGGMQSASLERGASVLEEKWKDLKPDLVILDYGMTDQVSRGLNPWLQPFAALARENTALYRELDAVTREHSTGLLGGSYLFTELVNRGMENVLPANREHWRGLVQSVIAKARERGIRVLLLDQPVAGMPAEVYRKAVAGQKNADFLSVREVLAGAAASASAPPSVVPDWLTEFPEAFQAYYEARVPYYFYLGSILHINALGHKEVARALETWIEKNGVLP